MRALLTVFWSFVVFCFIATFLVGCGGPVGRQPGQPDWGMNNGSSANSNARQPVPAPPNTDNTLQAFYVPMHLKVSFLDENGHLNETNQPCPHRDQVFKVRYEVDMQNFPGWSIYNPNQIAEESYQVVGYDTVSRVVTLNKMGEIISLGTGDVRNKGYVVDILTHWGATVRTQTDAYFMTFMHQAGNQFCFHINQQAVMLHYP